MCPLDRQPVFDSYPAWIVLLASALSVSIYLLGAAILLQFGMWAVFLYLAVCLFLEGKLLATACVHCYYFGRRCFSGKGVVSAWLFKKGDPKIFANREVSWKELLPDMLVALLPVGAGIFLLIRDFQWPVLVMLLGLLLLAFPGNGFVRGKLACCHCRQRELSCPAEKLFKKQNAKGG
ncbi:hypothetical protein JW933_03040 [candidate division FCPU426 bacterium]|nr:hypothetical protein [candidate division FCPU426 bacterium]